MEENDGLQRLKKWQLIELARSQVTANAAEIERLLNECGESGLAREALQIENAQLKERAAEADKLQEHIKVLNINREVIQNTLDEERAMRRQDMANVLEAKATTEKRAIEAEAARRSLERLVGRMDGFIRANHTEKRRLVTDVKRSWDGRIADFVETEVDWWPFKSECDQLLPVARQDALQLKQQMVEKE